MKVFELFGAPFHKLVRNGHVAQECLLKRFFYLIGFTRVLVVRRVILIVTIVVVVVVMSLVVVQVGKLIIRFTL